MALTNQEQIQIDDIDTRVSVNSGNISKNQADIQGIDNQNYLKLVKRSFVYTGCEIAKSGSDLSISLSKGSDAKSIAFVEGKYIEVLDNIAFIPANTSGSTRIDLIYLSKEGGLLIKSGVAGSGLAPSLPSNSLEIYTISIPTTTANLSSCTLLDRRINVNSGHYLPTVGVALNESFLLTQQDGSNLAGLYYWDGSNWNILSSGGLVANYYTKDSVDVLSAGMTEAEFRARQAENKRNRDGSGFDSFGKSYTNTTYGVPVNEGITAWKVYPNSISLGNNGLSQSSNSKTNLPIINTNGIPVHLDSINKQDNERNNCILLPDAPTDEKARQDLIGLEYWEEETDNVHPKGCTQSLATTLNGIATVVASFSGADTYSRFGTWQTAGDLVGRVVKFSTATVLQKMAMLSAPENCLFYNELGNLTQGKNRVRVIKGKTSNGAEWGSVVSTNNSTSLNSNFYDGSYYVKPKGKNTFIPSDLNNWNLDLSGFYGSFGYPTNNSDNNKKKIGHFMAFTKTDGGYDTNVAYKGNCFFMPIAMVSRNRNQGAYHLHYNSEGTKKFIDDKNWNETSEIITSTADCFDNAKVYVNSGNISSGKSGHPNGLYYDQILSSDIKDLRIPSKFKKDINSQLTKYTSSKFRGYESKKKLKEFSFTCDFHIYSGSSETSYLRANDEVIEDFIDGTQGGFIDFFGYVKLDDGNYYEVVHIEPSGGNSYIHVSKKYGDVSSQMTDSNSYTLYYWIDTDKFQNDIQKRCEILGDPSNLSNTNIEAVINLHDVNSGASNLPADQSDVGGGGEGKAFRLRGRTREFSINTVIYVTNSSGALIKYTMGGFGSQYSWDYSSSENQLYLNFKQSYGSLGYSSNTDMANNCNVFVFFDGYSNSFKPSTNRKIYKRDLSDVYMVNNHSHAYGAVLLNELLTKISNNNTVAPIYTSKKLIEYSISENSTLINSSSYPITLSMPVNLGANSSPSIMIFMYPTVKDGLIYNCINFEELKHNGSSWSSDQKFSAEDYIKLAVKNSESIILGTVIDQNPVGFADPEFE